MGRPLEPSETVAKGRMVGGGVPDFVLRFRLHATSRLSYNSDSRWDGAVGRCSRSAIPNAGHEDHSINDRCGKTVSTRKA